MINLHSKDCQGQFLNLELSCKEILIQQLLFNWNKILIKLYFIRIAVARNPKKIKNKYSNPSINSQTISLILIRKK